jgi:putative ABC transport system substrate-binding protein
MRRREFIAGIGATICPSIAIAQRTARVGLLASNGRAATVKLIGYIMEGLRQTGYQEGRNLEIVYRSAEGEVNRLPSLVAELVRSSVDVIIAPGSTPATLAARDATSSIPNIMALGVDPVALGLVRGLARPGGNVTGVSMLSTEMISRRFELLQHLLPAGRSLALLVNPTNALATPIERRETEVAASALRVDLKIYNAANFVETEAAYKSMTEFGVAGSIVSADTIFFGMRARLVPLAARFAIPTMYQFREFVEDGGLMSYGPVLSDLFRIVGAYAGRILSGERAADLPVQQPTKFELLISLKTAGALGLTIPETLLTTADEVIQ